MSDKTESVTWISFVTEADQLCLVSDKTKSVTGIGFVSDNKMSADFC